MENLYSTAAQIMRYPFIVIVALMLIVLIGVSVSEFRARKHVMGQVGKYIGCLEVADFDDIVRVGVAAENVIGSSPKSDIIIDDESVAKTHAMLRLKDGRVMLLPLEGSTRINGRRAAREHQVYSGDTLSFGDVECTLILKGASAGIGRIKPVEYGSENQDSGE